jgi:predicted SprT family Zn-dependent metalloprotease
VAEGLDTGRAPDEAALRAWVRELSLAHFGVAFPGEVRLAPRLRHRAADFTPATGTIRLSGPYLELHGAAAGRAVLLHELCHWWLWRQGVPHREDSAEFRALLHRHGAPPRARPMPRRMLEYRCPHCLQRYRLPVAGWRRACGACCRRFAGGRFDARFALVRVKEGPA